MRKGPFVAALVLSALAGFSTPSNAQARLHLLPVVAAGTSFDIVDNRAELFGEGIEAWSFGGQMELVTSSRWTPAVAVNRWHFDDVACDLVRCETAGWGAEGGVSYSNVPTSIIRPYGGFAVGVRKIGTVDRYAHGRAGLDFTPRFSPLTFRLEGRYLVSERPGGPLVLLTTGIRFALPTP